MVAKFARSKIPHPTPAVCKASEPPITTDIDPCLPTDVQIAISINDLNIDGTVTSGAGLATGTNGGAGTIWNSTSVVLGLDVVAAIEHGDLPDRWTPSATVKTPLGVTHVMGTGQFPAKPCPPFETGPMSRPLIPGPGTITLSMYG